MNDDELFRRMHQADPARRDAPAESWLDDLVEETMSTPSERTRRRWVPVAAAAAVVAMAAGGVGFAMDRGGVDAPAVQSQPKTVTQLRMPREKGISGMCIRISAEALRNVDQALEGTATEVTDDRVVLTVDKWYKGGDTDLVALTPANPDMVALTGAIQFEQGQKYLVTAADGTVNSCGFSGPYSSELAALYVEAFSE
jgi:hypothetical protein